VHKAQGSEWPKVLLIDEGRCFRDAARRWTYTGITRAQEEITIVV
jgi:ATP-dependent exoDNAse (exonuclease V) alpha subunit